jgi:lipopolysaccharide export system protein LptC
VTADKPPSSEPQNLESRVFRPSNDVERRQAVDVAFDYRGDVTLELTSGEKIEGYIFNRNASVSSPVLQLFPKDQAGTRVVPYADIATIALTGEDTASGKSWEAWVKKKESERKTEAEQSKADAQARGYL